MTRSYSNSWDKLIGEALPKRELQNRDFLVHVIADSVRRWKKAQPEIAPYAEKIRALTDINARLKVAIEETGSELHEIGVAEDIKRIEAENAALGIGPPRDAMSGRSAAVDLYLVAHRAIDGLRTWDKWYRPRRGRPRSFASQLAETISLHCKEANLSSYETENILAALSGIDDLPQLTIATVNKRQHRAKKRTRTK